MGTPAAPGARITASAARGKGRRVAAPTAVPGVAQAVQNSGKIGKIAVTGYGSPQTAGPFLDAGAMTSTGFWDAEKLGSLTVWALDKIAKGESFDAQNDVPGFDKPIAYDDSTKTLLLGPPQIFTKKDWRQYKF